MAYHPARPGGTRPLIARLAAMLLSAVLAAAVGESCRATTSDAAGQRYVDEVFASVTVTHDLVYGRAVDEYGQLQDLTLDLYQPAGDTLAERPVLIWAHGGGFVGGSKSDSSVVGLVSAFARRGYVTASVEYRLREGWTFTGYDDPLFIETVTDAQYDGKAAIRWVRANAPSYRIDTSRIVMGGNSAGAVTALFAAYTPDVPGDSGNPGYWSGSAAVISFAGSIPTSLIDAGEPPVMLVHGTLDTTVPYADALAIVARTEELGIYSELHPLEGQPHGVFAQYWDETVLWGADFLYRRVIAPAGVGGVAMPEPEDGAAGRYAWFARPPIWIGAALSGFAALLIAAALRRRSAR